MARNLRYGPQTRLVRDISYQCYVFRVTLAMVSVVGIGACIGKVQLCWERRRHCLKLGAESNP